MIGTSSGLLYHCIAIESEFDDEKNQGTADTQEMCSVITSTNINVIIPETILYVIETIELSFPLTSADQDTYNSNNFNGSLLLIRDIRDPKRYLCLHSFGIHIVMVSFCKQLFFSCQEYYDEKSIVEYLICTRPTIETNASDKTKCELFPLGMATFISRGFTYIAVLLNSAELIFKRLSNVILPDSLSNVFTVKNNEASFEVLSTDKKSIPQISPKATFLKHIEQILQRTTNMPLIKSSKPRNSNVNVQELEMLLNSINVFNKEYLDKFNLAIKLIEQRKKILKNMCQVQVSLI